MSQQLTAVSARWTLLPGSDGGLEAAEGVTVVVRGNRIEDVLRHPFDGTVDHWVELPGGVLLPGFVNLHNHGINGPIFRGIVDDIVEDERSDVRADNIVYSLLLPLGDLASEVLSAEELRAVYRLAVLELLRSGTTSVHDMPRSQHHWFLAVAEEMGVRAFAAPYIFSAPGRGPLESALAVADRYDQGAGGRIRVGFGPHATDTCSPDLLRRIARLARERDSFVSIHVAQSRLEVDAVRRDHGRTPVEYLGDLGLLGPRTVAAHCVYVEDGDLALLRDSGTTVAHCPLTFARSGVTVSFDRFHRYGVRTGIGTDAYSFDYLAELRAAGFVAKLTSGDSGAATAGVLLRAATETGASALADDLGTIAPGRLADLVGVDLTAPHVQPVRDPTRNLVWNATSADVSLVMVDGRVLMEDGWVAGVDQHRIVTEAASAVDRLWRQAEVAGVLPALERSPA